MSIAESLIPEFNNEMKTTRSLLERVPEDKADWKPHQKSMSLGKLSIHLATLPSLAIRALNATEMDMNPPGGPAFVPPSFESLGRTLELFDKNEADVREALSNASDAELMTEWSLKNGGATIFAMPRVAVLRSIVMNHIIHHRGQLSVYLRLLDVPLPSIYGPSADTPM
jgi:uncharacterized damage-inducible protein DinB